MAAPPTTTEWVRGGDASFDALSTGKVVLGPTESWTSRHLDRYLQRAGRSDDLAAEPRVGEVLGYMSTLYGRDLAYVRLARSHGVLTKHVFCLPLDLLEENPANVAPLAALRRQMQRNRNKVVLTFHPGFRPHTPWLGLPPQHKALLR